MRDVWLGDTAFLGVYSFENSRNYRMIKADAHRAFLIRWIDARMRCEDIRNGSGVRACTEIDERFAGVWSGIEIVYALKQSSVYSAGYLIDRRRSIAYRLSVNFGLGDKCAQWTLLSGSISNFDACALDSWLNGLIVRY